MAAAMPSVVYMPEHRVGASTERLAFVACQAWYISRSQYPWGGCRHNRMGNVILERFLVFQRKVVLQYRGLDVLLVLERLRLLVLELELMLVLGR